MRRVLLWVLMSILSLPMHVSADELTPEDALSSLWRALPNEPGGRADTVVLRRLFHPDAVVFGGRYKDRAPSLRRTSAEEFLAPYEKIGVQGFHECEVYRVVQAYDRFAVAYSVVESRTDKAASKPDFVGVNSLQLYKVGSQWKVLSLYYHVQTPDTPVQYGDGAVGKCVG